MTILTYYNFYRIKYTFKKTVVPDTYWFFFNCKLTRNLNWVDETLLKLQNCYHL